MRFEDIRETPNIEVSRAKATQPPEAAVSISPGRQPRNHAHKMARAAEGGGIAMIESRSETNYVAPFGGSFSFVDGIPGVHAPGYLIPHPPGAARHILPCSIG